DLAGRSPPVDRELAVLWAQDVTIETAVRVLERAFGHDSGRDEVDQGPRIPAGGAVVNADPASDGEQPRLRARSKEVPDRRILRDRAQEQVGRVSRNEV